MYVGSGVVRGRPDVPLNALSLPPFPPPPSLRGIFLQVKNNERNLIVKMAKVRESEESAWHKSLS